MKVTLLIEIEHTQKMEEEATTNMNVNEQSTTMVANIGSSSSKTTSKMISDKLKKKKETIKTTTLYFIKRLACNGKQLTTFA